MEQLIKTIVLGFVQGLTEWLPISSTGHLKLFETFLGLKTPILFDVILHIGTLIVTLIFFRKKVWKILSSLLHFDFKTESGQMVPMIIAGTIPTLLIGLVFGQLIEDTFQTSCRVGVAFLLCGIILYSAKIGEEKTDTINYSTAILMGLAQGVAIIPGISRSGTTITVALLLGTKRNKAFEFSFLLSIPAVISALGYSAITESGQLASAGIELAEIFAGALVAVFVGYLALKLLWKTIARGKFYLFAFYCSLLGVLLLILEISQPFGLAR